ncbi:helix-turn-helix domain-containing protein [Streptomyces sp. NPDC004042]|uniref:PucR family transcriptional regulator n=1 Tax=Streptomyces sp. NPDC004042 TaxID=3154451 RepID=UPI0033A076EE
MAEPGIAEEHLKDYARIVAEASATGRRLTRDELRGLRARGEQAAEAGLSLRALVRRHLVAIRESSSANSAADVDHVLAAAEQAIDAFAEGHERAQRLAVRQEEAARQEFIDDLLYGRSELGRLAERAERFGLLLSQDHAVAVAESRLPGGETYPAAGQVESALVGRFGDRRILLTAKAGRLICIAPGDQDDVLTFFAEQTCAINEDSRVAIGRSHSGVGGVVHSYEEALNTLTLAARLGLGEPVLRANDLLVYPVLVRDQQALTDLVQHTLSPLRTARGGAQPLIDTLAAYFDSGCTAAEAARRLSLSARALTYRLERIRKLTGVDPTVPAQRYTLQTAVIGARLLRWPDEDV